MNFDFALLLVILTALSGVLWAWDAWFLAPRRRAAVAALDGKADTATTEVLLRQPVFADYARSFFPIFLIVLLLRSFLVEPFRIPSGSMMPTLLVGDFILVNKYHYGIRLPVINKKIIPIDAPRRGDIVVFRYPRDPSIPFIKRVIGVPGDQVAYRDKTLYINGEAIAQEPAGTYIGVGTGAGQSGDTLRLEHLDGIDHQILITPGKESREGGITIPEGQYFVMGDNRDNSMDSRYWGTVPDENLIGRAFMIWMNWDGKNGGVDWRRLGRKIQ